MSAEHAVRRKRTAREVAEQLGVSPRTVRRFVAEPRDDYLGRAEQRRQQIRELREQGLSMRAIAAEVGCSVGTVHNALNYQNQNKGSHSDHVEA
ncbi:helix-turn-helix domain-containing protein, partial [Enteractinococcus coprophilus]|uniref:helix-turn-helix domain-containing protein n=2 Tax=Actinomycetota TaxID=201174 RepID=UPI0036516649